MSEAPKLRIAVCGGGIGGMAVALSLSKYPDLKVNVYEAANKLGEVGAGINVFLRHWKILEKLGVAEDLSKLTGGGQPFLYRASDSENPKTFFHTPPESSGRGFHRAHFHATIHKHLPDRCQVHCSKRLKSYEHDNTGSVVLKFEDGSTETCDVLIGADGLRSQVRRKFLTDLANSSRAQGKEEEVKKFLRSIEPVWTGVLVIRELIPAEKLREKYPEHLALTAPIIYFGTNIITAYPVAENKYINSSVTVAKYNLEGTPYNGPWTRNGSTDDNLTEVFGDREPQVKTLIEFMKNPSQWAVHAVVPLSTYVSDNVVLLGDAAHAMLPHLGAGAGQAIEDAYILGAILGHPKTQRSNLAEALKIYDSIRRPHGVDIQEKSRLNCRYLTYAEGIDLSTRSDEKLWDESLDKLRKRIYNTWRWVWETTADDMYKETMERLEEL